MKNFEEKLPVASAEWVSEGLISIEQRSKLLARHPATPGSGNRFIAVITTIGATLLAFGVILIIGSNWQDIGDWTKIGGLLTLLILTNALGWRLKVMPGTYPKVGDAILMMGCILFLGGIALVSQIFHLNSRPATGVMIWWLGILPVPWLTHSKGAQFVAIVALLTWLGFEFTADGGLLRLYLENNYGDRAVVYWFAIYAMLGMWLLLFGLGLRGSRASHFAGLHEKWGLIILCVGLYMLGFARHFTRYYYLNWDVNLNPLPFALVAGLLIPTAVWAWRSSRKEMVGLGPWLLFSLIPMGLIVSNWNLAEDNWLPSALAWLGLFLVNLYMIRIGLVTGHESWVNLGIGFIGLNILSRYFDFFDSMLAGGEFFIVTGVVIIALGIFLEKKRRQLMAKLRTKEVS